MTNVRIENSINLDLEVETIVCILQGDVLVEFCRLGKGAVWSRVLDLLEETPSVEKYTLIEPPAKGGRLTLPPFEVEFSGKYKKWIMSNEEVKGVKLQ